MYHEQKKVGEYVLVYCTHSDQTCMHHVHRTARSHWTRTDCIVYWAAAARREDNTLHIKMVVVVEKEEGRSEETVR